MVKRISYTILLQILFALAINSQAITRFEYFIDTDPGIGNGIALNVTAADSVSINILLNANTLTPGQHIVGIRSMDNNGVWSYPEFARLYVETQDTLNRQMINAEFFIGNTDPGFGLAKNILINNPADSVTLIADTILNNLPIGNYKINVRFKDGRGIWSHLETRSFSVCATYGPLSQMIYQTEGNTVFFTNHSENVITQLWKFGDNTTGTVLNPIKTYGAAGNYNLQLITNNVCGDDTLRETIRISGLQRVNADHAGNSGISTLMFEGFGFTPSTDVKLILGSNVFTPVLKTFINSYRISANFNLTGFTTGVYRAMATLGSAFDTLDNALTIGEAIPVTLTLDVPDGRAIARTGRVQIVGTIKNNGSEDAVMVPYINVGNVLTPLTDVNTNPFVLTGLVPLLNQGVFQQAYQYLSDNNVPPEVMYEYDLDSARNRQIVAYYRTRVPANSSVVERVKFPHTGSSYSFQTGALVLGPLLDSYAYIDSIHTDYQPCYSSFLKQAVKNQLNVSINDATWNSCFVTAFDTLIRTLVNISQNPLYENFGVSMQACFSALLSQMAGCSGSGVPANLGGIQFKRIIQEVMNNWVYLDDIDSLDSDCVDTTVKVFARILRDSVSAKQLYDQRLAATGCDQECDGAAVFPEMCDQCLPLIVAGKVGKKLKIKGHAFSANSGVKGCQEWCETTSVDPNSKYGPGNNGDKKYINHTKEVSYKITFENLATATSPAAFVEIRDTIDKSVYNISSLRLGLFSWGDSVIIADPNEQNVSYLKNIKPAHPNFLRIDATTDTAAGIITWKFWTVDTVTLQLTTDPTEGFLPPNTDGVSGAGFVSYSIAPDSTVTNGTQLKNHATIVFDQNTPISTNEWEYRIDTLQPSSAVNSLPPVTNTSSFNVSWSGTDGHAGINRYSIYVSTNDSAYQVWRQLTDLTSDVFNGQFGKTYKFFSVTLDKAGNYEDPPADAINNPDAVTIIQGPLPLNLLSFTATKTTDNKKVNLSWETTNEQNVSHFVIERSADRINYSAIASVLATNNAGGASYQWQDNSPLPKINYYRLRIVDLDSSNKLSPVKMIRFAEGGEILVFPTIVSDLVFVQSEKEITAELYNTTGQKLEIKTFRDNGNFDLRKYPAGIYVLRIGNNSYRVIKK
ncbi:MAG TPA: PKD domain-containing protein [Chitinophagaceae bacterium]|nr:PKD domain-containing protein [Chitinophagaceae bacterium]